MATGWRGSYYRYKQLFLNVSELYKKRADLRAFLEIVLSITAVIVFLLYAIKPTILTITSLVKQINEEKQTLLSLTKKVNDIKTAQTLLSENEQYLDNIEVAVASAPAPDVFAKQILGISAKDGVELIGMSFGGVTLLGSKNTTKASGDVKPLPENAKEMEYSIRVRGIYASINTFVKDVENMRVISAIDNISISSSQTETGRVIVAVITGRVPYLGN